MGGGLATVRVGWPGVGVATRGQGQLRAAGCAQLRTVEKTKSLKLLICVREVTVGPLGTVLLKSQLATASDQCPQSSRTSGEVGEVPTTDVAPPEFIERSGGLHYLPTERAAIAFSICSLMAAILKLAPPCIGGKSMNDCAACATCCWTNTKRQNS